MLFQLECQLNLFHFAEARTCQTHTIRLMERSLVGVTVFCTEKPQNITPFLLQPVYRINNVTGIYRLSGRESYICYDVQVLPSMVDPAQLGKGRYYEIVNKI